MFFIPERVPLPTMALNDPLGGCGPRFARFDMEPLLIRVFKVSIIDGLWFLVSRFSIFSMIWSFFACFLLNSWKERIGSDCFLCWRYLLWCVSLNLSSLCLSSLWLSSCRRPPFWRGRRPRTWGCLRGCSSRLVLERCACRCQCYICWPQNWLGMWRCACDLGPRPSARLCCRRGRPCPGRP